LLWDAWLKVKDNGGAAGADGVTIEQFEKDLSGNLYRLWNVRNECRERAIGRCLPD
jgi:RNA-directed DNA polymerase